MNFRKIPYGAQKNFSVFENTMVEMTWQEVQTAADQEPSPYYRLG